MANLENEVARLYADRTHPPSEVPFVDGRVISSECGIVGDYAEKGKGYRIDITLGSAYGKYFKFFAPFLVQLWREQFVRMYAESLREEKILHRVCGLQVFKHRIPYEHNLLFSFKDNGYFFAKK